MIDIKDYVKKDLEKYDGVYMPVKANLAEQLFIKNLNPLKLHPNPDDEFSMKSVGPNDGIIQDYIKKIRFNQQHNLPIFEEPLIVEKMKPEGYMLINGHHRWAAALLLGLKKIPVKVVNMTHVEDILESLEKTNRVKRASVNLDDVVFCQNNEEPFEKPRFHFYNLIYREHIRKGIPALFYTLQNEGYDVWVYSSGYRSADHISWLLDRYEVYANTIINGAERRNTWNSKELAEIREKMEKKYRVTLNIDTDAVSWIRSDTKEFDQIPVKSHGEEWAKEVISIIRDLKNL